jgi:outer membrane protein
MANCARHYKQTTFKQSRESIMKKLFTFILISLALSNVGQAQTPTQNLMPDGSHDMYVGLGAVLRPSYEGATKYKRAIVPVMQVQWSNGAFISGMSAGWHLSQQPQHDFGPLIMLEPSRTPSGLSNGINPPGILQGNFTGPEYDLVKTSNKLIGLDSIQARLLVGAFYHYPLTENLRQTNIIVFGAGNDKNGLRLSSDLRFRFSDLPAHHLVTLGIGLNIINQAYAQSYFGVSDAEARRTLIRRFQAKAGVKDVHLDANWNWNLSSSWLLTSKIQLGQLVGSASDSPLVERRTNVTVSSALAYRF